MMIELPEYKLPDARTVAIYVWEKVKDYLGKAGTTIFLATLVIWALLNFGPQGYAPDMTGSFGAVIGKWLTPFFVPIGLGFWQIAVALMAGISAKEVVVSSCAVLFGIVNASSPEGMSAFATALEGIGFGPAQRLLLNGVLPALHSLRRFAGYHTQRVGQLGMDGFHCLLSVSGSLVSHLCGVSNWFADSLKQGEKI